MPLVSNISSAHPYQALTPDTVLDAVESVGYLSDLRVLALNSYENRVYQVGIEEQAPLIAKFYRPGRWSKEQIQEEHDFTQELLDLEIPVIAPIRDQDGRSVFEYESFLFSLSPRKGGHPPQLDDKQVRLTLGRFIGRIHECGRSKPFAHRPVLDIFQRAQESCTFLLENDFIPMDLATAYKSTSAQLLATIKERVTASPYAPLRLHGDCHTGNVLWRDDTAFFVDFDDVCSGPAVQDLWLMLWGDTQEQSDQLSGLLEGYQEFTDFSYSELSLIESLRTARIMYYSAWLARRWDDPAFPLAFPWFNTQAYWETHVLTLREQEFAMSQPALCIG